MSRQGFPLAPEASCSGSAIEMIFEIKTRGEIKLKSIDAISSIDGVKSVNWIVESGDTIG